MRARQTDHRQCFSPPFGRIVRWAVHHSTLLPLFLGLLLCVSVDGPPPNAVATRVRRQVAGRLFSFAGWEIQALAKKTLHNLLAPQRYMPEPARCEFVLGYLQLVGELQRLDGEIQRVYTDPQAADPAAMTAGMRARLAGLRYEEEQRQLLAEAILDEQVAVILAAEGFDILGQVFAPPASHFTPLPLMLVVSPRERIEMLYSLSLKHGLDTAEQEAIENRVDRSLNVSSLVTHIGGMAAYPSMLLESSSLPWITEVIAHEWTHHYLTFRPLGWNYEASSETRTINETVASIVGKEIGRRTLERFYPEFVPQERPPTSPVQAPEPVEAPIFDFRREMRITRICVDELLAEGRIEEAEAYMEERRRVFVAHGYLIRKLNQAYFAFYGAYADEPGAAGTDPIGPLVSALRQRSPNLYTFVTRVARVTTRADLEALVGVLTP